MQNNKISLMIVDLHISSKNVLVIGGGEQATKRISSIIDENCAITVVSPKFSAGILDMAGDGNITIHQREANMATLQEMNPDIVIVATDNHTLNSDIMRVAKEMGIMRYSVSDPQCSDYAHLAIVKFRDLVQIAVSTNGKSPTMAKRIRNNIKDNISDIVTLDIIDGIHAGRLHTH